MPETFVRAFNDSIQLKQLVINDNHIKQTIEVVAKKISQCFKQNGQVLFCGNGGSAADAQHLAAEFSGRYLMNRSPLNAEALHVNTSFLTAVANDFSYNDIYARLVEAKGKEGDVLIGISTSGNSQNIINALQIAKKNKIITVGLTGHDGGLMKEYCDYLLNVPSIDTPRIQEVHILLGHIICEIVEKNMFA